MDIRLPTPAPWYLKTRPASAGGYPVQPRRGGRMALRARTGGMLVYTAHLESGGNDTLRRKQLNEMVRDQQRQARPDERVVLAGDFNNQPAAQSSMFGAIRSERFIDSHGTTPRLTSIGRPYPNDWISSRISRSSSRTSTW